MGPSCNGECLQKKEAKGDLTTGAGRQCDGGGRDGSEAVCGWREGPHALGFGCRKMDRQGNGFSPEAPGDSSPVTLIH